MAYPVSDDRKRSFISMMVIKGLQEICGQRGLSFVCQQSICELLTRNRAIGKGGGMCIWIKMELIG